MAGRSRGKEILRLALGHRQYEENINNEEDINNEKDINNEEDEYYGLCNCPGSFGKLNLFLQSYQY